MLKVNSIYTIGKIKLLSLLTMSSIFMDVFMHNILSKTVNTLWVWLVQLVFNNKL